MVLKDAFRLAVVGGGRAGGRAAAAPAGGSKWMSSWRDASNVERLQIVSAAVQQ